MGPHLGAVVQDGRDLQPSPRGAVERADDHLRRFLTFLAPGDQRALQTQLRVPGLLNPQVELRLRLRSRGGPVHAHARFLADVGQLELERRPLGCRLVRIAPLVNPGGEGQGVAGRVLVGTRIRPPMVVRLAARLEDRLGVRRRRGERPGHRDRPGHETPVLTGQQAALLQHGRRVGIHASVQDRHRVATSGPSVRTRHLDDATDRHRVVADSLERRRRPREVRHAHEPRGIEVRTRRSTVGAGVGGSALDLEDPEVDREIGRLLLNAGDEIASARRVRGRPDLALGGVECVARLLPVCRVPPHRHGRHVPRGRHPSRPAFRRAFDDLLDPGGDRGGRVRPFLDRALSNERHRNGAEDGPDCPRVGILGRDLREILRDGAGRGGYRAEEGNPEGAPPRRPVGRHRRSPGYSTPGAAIPTTVAASGVPARARARDAGDGSSIGLGRNSRPRCSGTWRGTGRRSRRDDGQHERGVGGERKPRSQTRPRSPPDTAVQHDDHARER